MAAVRGTEALFFRHWSYNPVPDFGDKTGTMLAMQSQFRYNAIAT